jgi:hypothetical protein
MGDSGRKQKLLSGSAEASPVRLIDEMSRWYYLSRAIHVAAEIGVADCTGPEQQPAPKLAEKTGTHARALERLLRYLASYGIFEETEPAHFRSTELSDVMREDHPQSLRPQLLRIAREWWNAAGAMHYSVKSGNSAFPYVNNVEFFEFLAQNREQQRRFDTGMAQISKADDAAIAEAYDFSGFESIVDVGGGRGGLLAEILKRAPSARGILFDQPQVVEHAVSLEENGLTERCDLIGGDFFQSVPKGAECYVIKGVLHDFDDDQCVNILRNCRDATTAGGRVLVVERVLPSSQDGPHPNLTMDIQMMIILRGRERQASEWREIYARAGLKVTRLIDTSVDFTVIEGSTDRKA